jgi:hypothetical protein
LAKLQNVAKRLLLVHESDAGKELRELHELYQRNKPATMYYDSNLNRVEDHNDGGVLKGKTKHPYRVLVEYVATHGQASSVPVRLIQHSADFDEDQNSITRSVVFALFFRYLSGVKHTEYVHRVLVDLFEKGYLPNPELWSKTTLRNATLEQTANYREIVHNTPPHIVQDFIQLFASAQRHVVNNTKATKGKGGTRRRRLTARRSAAQTSAAATVRGRGRSV